MSPKMRLLIILNQILSNGRAGVDEPLLFILQDAVIHVAILLGLSREEAISLFTNLAESHFWVPPEEIGGFAHVVNDDGTLGKASDTSKPTPDDTVAMRLLRQVFDGTNTASHTGEDTENA